jgi:hypothetical protein
MKKLMVFLLLIVSGCSVTSSTETIMVQQLSEDMLSYKTIFTIDDSKQMKDINKILDEAKWEKKAVQMSRAADYRFIISIKDAKCVGTQYLFWINRQQQSIELVQEDGCKESLDPYVKLSPHDSAALFKLLTDEDISTEISYGGYDYQGEITKIDANSNQFLLMDKEAGHIWIEVERDIEITRYKIGDEVLVWTNGFINKSVPPSAKAIKIEFIN